MKRVKGIVLLGLAATGFGGASCRVEAPPPDRTSATHPARPAERQVTHVVLVWLKNPGDAEARRKIIDSARELRTIPGVVSVRAGPVLPSTRPVVDSTFDVGLVVTFTGEKAMREYVTHPTHVRLLNEVLKPNLDHYKAYDFTAGEVDLSNP